MYEGVQLPPLSNLVAGCLVLPPLEGEGDGAGAGGKLTIVFLPILMTGLCLDFRFRDL